jgi:hypothetical protein
MSGPTGNTAELVKDLNELGGTNASALNVFSAAIGTLADASGAIGGIVGAVEGIVSLFNPNQPDACLAKVLNAIQQYLAAMYTDIEARFQEQFWQHLSTLIGTAEGVVAFR